MRSTFLNEEETKRDLCEFIMNSDKLSMGECVSKFETKFSEWQGRRHSVMVNSGSSANLVLLQALLNLKYIPPGARIGVSAVTWATNVMPIIQLGCVPVLVEVSRMNMNVMSEYLPKDIDLLFITHLLGFCGDIGRIDQFCKLNNILLIEDTCESLGTIIEHDKKLGNYGIASTFSTFVGHHMSTIEGGIVSTDNKELNDMLRMVRAHGWDRNVDEKKRTELRTQWNIDDFYGPYTFYTLGYNVRPTEIQGFIGLKQLDHIDSANNKRKKSFKIIQQYINKVPGLYSPRMKVPAFAIPVICKDKKTKDLYVSKCIDNAIEVRPLVAGSMNKQPYFKEYVTTKTPNADYLHDSAFYIPNHPDLTDDEIKHLYSIFIV
jgi:CDP-6-deoxy-D-xylo-4-hexulose-3-dehydrase